MSEVLDKVRRLNLLLQESHNGMITYRELCDTLSDLMEANVYVIDSEGIILGESLKIEEDRRGILDEALGKYVLPKDCNDSLKKVKEASANLQGEQVVDLFEEDYDLADKIHTIIPIVGGGTRWGTFIMTRYDREFTEEEQVLAEYGATIVGLAIHQQKLEDEKQEARELSVVRMAIDTLSYSEAEAVQRIFAELEGDEGVLVASRIADESGITRSVIVNALRKLESASVIETRSLGMKGTRIRILNPKLKSELKNNR